MEVLLQQILDKLNEIAENQKTFISTVRENKNHGFTSVMSEEISNPPGGIYIKDWNTILKKRKMAYYKKIRNEGIKTEYENNLKEDPPRIPRKFKESSFPGQSDSQTERMKKLEITKLELEIERLEEEKIKNESIISNAECEIKQLISKYNDPEQRQKLNEKWFSEIKQEEKISNEIWKKNATFFNTNTETSEQQERGPQKIHNTNKFRRNSSYGNYHVNHYEHNYDPYSRYHPSMRFHGNANRRDYEHSQGRRPQWIHRNDGTGNYNGNRGHNVENFRVPYRPARRT